MTQNETIISVSSILHKASIALTAHYRQQNATFRSLSISTTDGNLL
jgi:hypothetical protein